MLLDSTLWFKWSTDDSTWSPRPRLLINRYDPLGNLISEIHSGSSNPENDEWANYDSCGYVYDNFGRIIKRVQYKWDSKTNEWLEYEGRFNTYDTSGNITETEYSWWDWNCVVDDRGRDIKTYTYDSNGSITEHISYDWNPVNLEWEARYRRWETFDSNGNITEHISYDWNRVNLEWEARRRTWKTYDSSGNLTDEGVEYRGRNTNEWEQYGSNKYVYDSIGNLIEKFEYEFWDSNTNEWKRCDRDVYTYDASGNLAEETTYWWTSTSATWVRMGGWVNEYDSLGRRIARMYGDWNSVTNEWKASMGYFYTYDNYGNISKQEQKSWDSEINDWIGIERSIHTYDSSGNLVDDIKYEWNHETNDWKETRVYCDIEISYKCLMNCLHGVCRLGRRSYIYDSIGKLSEDILYDWDPEAEVWKHKQKWSYHWSSSYSDLIGDQTFYLNENCSDTSVAGSVASGNIHLGGKLTFSIIARDPDSIFSIDAASGNLLINNIINIDYETQDLYQIKVKVSDSLFQDESTITIRVTDLDETYVENIQADWRFHIYPNPTNDLFTIETDGSDLISIEITSLNGNLLINKKMEGATDQLDLSSFQKGVYFITLRSADFVSTRKIIKL